MKTIEETVKLLQEGSHAIFMDRREPKDIELLKKILKLAFPLDKSTENINTNWKYYFKDKSEKIKWFCYDFTNLTPIPITQITDSEHFENGEEVEVSDKGDVWYKYYYVGKSRDGLFAVESENCNLKWFEFIRKLNPERTKAIETIKELIEKFNIKNEEI
jgi:hypothetical protein